MSGNGLARVLMIDDEPHILAGFQRLLGRRFDLTCVESGSDAISRLRAGEVFPVIVTDMRMPGMTGVELLAQVCEMRTESVCLMLTGNADQQTAIDAINRGHVYRFLTKPCAPDVLEAAIQEAVRKYDVAHAERVLLKETVAGSVRMLLGAIELSNPRLAEAQALIKSHAKELMTSIGLQNEWQIPMAAQLSMFGLVTVPGLRKDQLLTEESVKMASLIGGELLTNIPRLQVVAQMVARQWEYGPLGEAPDLKSALPVTGARILRLALDVSREELAGHSTAAVLSSLQALGNHDARFFTGLRRASERVQSSFEPVDTSVQAFTLIQLSAGMKLAQDIITKDGLLLFTAGNELTQVAIVALRNNARLGNIPADIKISAIRPPRDPLQAAA